MRYNKMPSKKPTKKTKKIERVDEKGIVKEITGILKEKQEVEEFYKPF